MKCVFYAALLERVFLRLGSAESDEQLEAVLAKFLTPVLLKLASQTDGVRKKVISSCMLVCCGRQHMNTGTGSLLGHGDL